MISVPSFFTDVHHEADKFHLRQTGSTEWQHTSGVLGCQGGACVWLGALLISKGNGSQVKGRSQPRSVRAHAREQADGSDDKSVLITNLSPQMTRFYVATVKFALPICKHNTSKNTVALPSAWEQIYSWKFTAFGRPDQQMSRLNT